MHVIKKVSSYNSSQDTTSLYAYGVQIYQPSLIPSLQYEHESLGMRLLLDLYHCVCSWWGSRPHQDNKYH